MKACRRFALVAALFTLSVPAVRAGLVEHEPATVPFGPDPDWYVSLLSEQQTSVDVQPGDTVPVEIVLDRQNEHEIVEVETAVFNLHISNRGLLFEDYLWDAAYFDTGVPDDNSTRPTDPPSLKSIIHFDNLTVTGDHLFEEGILLSLSLGVPDDAKPGSVYEVTYEHDTLTNGCFFCFFHAEAIGPLTINVVPEPGTVVLLGAGAVVALGRRKKSVRAMANSVQPNSRMT